MRREENSPRFQQAVHSFPRVISLTPPVSRKLGEGLFRHETQETLSESREMYSTSSWQELVVELRSRISGPTCKPSPLKEPLDFFHGCCRFKRS